MLNVHVEIHNVATGHWFATVTRSEIGTDAKGKIVFQSPTVADQHTAMNYCVEWILRQVTERAVIVNPNVKVVDEAIRSENQNMLSQVHRMLSMSMALTVMSEITSLNEIGACCGQVVARNVQELVNSLQVDRAMRNQTASNAPAKVSSNIRQCYAIRSLGDLWFHVKKENGEIRWSAHWVDACPFPSLDAAKKFAKRNNITTGTFVPINVTDEFGPTRITGFTKASDNPNATGKKAKK
jgi:hypothetical protein